jgi:hypothetical protein
MAAVCTSDTYTGEWGIQVEALGGAAEIARALATGKGALLVWASLAVASLVVTIRWFTLKAKPRLSAKLGEVNWSFTDSWATTLTALGALLGTILSTAGVLPKSTKLLSTSALGGLNLLFGLMVLVAPLLFSSFARVRSKNTDDDEPSYQGTVWAFLAACILTLWAVIGELATIFVLLQEFTIGTLSASLSWLFVALAVMGAVLLVIYSWGTIRAIIDYREEEVLTEAAGVTTRPRRWSLL